MNEDTSEREVSYEEKYGYDKIKCYLIYYTRQLEGVYSCDNSMFKAEGMAVVMGHSPSEIHDLLREELGIKHQYWNGSLLWIELDVNKPLVHLIEGLDEFNKGRSIDKFPSRS